MESKSHQALVEEQFGTRAAAYLHSAVHAQGADLQALAALVQGQREARVLDLGCGGGHVGFALAPHVREVVAYDLSPEMLEVVARTAAERDFGNLVTRQGAVESLPFEDGSFDHVFSRYSAHHWSDFDAGLREAARVLKPGGIAAFVDSVSPGLPLLDSFLQSIEMLRDTSHVRSYSRAEWEAAIIRAGLRPGTAKTHRLRLDFASWVERMHTPRVRVDAIRALQSAMSAGVTRYFEIDAEGSFSIDVMLIETTKGAA